MNSAAFVAVALVAGPHFYILALEMFYWNTPRAQRALGLTPVFAKATRVLAANHAARGRAPLSRRRWNGSRGPLIACYAHMMSSCRVAYAAELVRRCLPFLLIGLLACRTTKPPPVQKQEERVGKQSPDEPGRRVSTGARSMYIECAGLGSPTVVFDAGLGGNSNNWEGVVVGVRRETRACRYDRLGTGRSDAAPSPHTPVDMALELNELLAAAGEQPPLVLVGHSLGGINVRLYVQNKPRAVVGLVLVESMHEDQQQRVAALAPHAQQQGRSQLEANGEGLTSGSLASGLEALRRGERSLGSRPLVVLSRGVPPPVLPGLSEETAQRMWAERQALQAELTHLSSNSVQVIAEQSGHAVLRDQPQLVVDATLEVVRAVRQGRRVQREHVLLGAAFARP